MRGPEFNFKYRKKKFLVVGDIRKTDREGIIGRPGSERC
jgi:hypothetical protein